MISVVSGRPESKVESAAGFTLSKLLLLLSVFVIIAFPTVVIGRKSFFYRDMGSFGYPLAHFHREAFQVARPFAVFDSRGGHVNYADQAVKIPAGAHQVEHFIGKEIPVWDLRCPPWDWLAVV